MLVAWAVLAWRRPGETYLFASALAAGTTAIVTRRRAGRALPRRLATLLTVPGLVSALVLTAALAGAGRLAGPDLLDGHRPVAEAVLLALGGT